MDGGVGRVVVVVWGDCIDCHQTGAEVTACMMLTTGKPLFYLQ
jgi:hypothetical protein